MTFYGGNSCELFSFVYHLTEYELYASQIYVLVSLLFGNRTLLKCIMIKKY